MHTIDPSTAAHALAGIFCDRNYDEIAKAARVEYASGGYKGDPDVFIARELWAKYSAVYDAVFDAADNEPEL